MENTPADASLPPIAIDAALALMKRVHPGRGIIENAQNVLQSGVKDAVELAQTCICLPDLSGETSGS
jgi:hypothetical protein